MRVYYPSGRDSKTPAIIWIHGGGFVRQKVGELVLSVLLFVTTPCPEKEDTKIITI